MFVLSQTTSSERIGIRLKDGVNTRMLSILAFVFVLGVMIFIHELGHFLTAKWVGVKVHVFSLDPHSRDPTVLRSTLYVTREHEAFIGQEAIDVYYAQNIGRPSRMGRRYVGEIELTVGDMTEFEIEFAGNSPCQFQ